MIFIKIQKQPLKLLRNRLSLFSHSWWFFCSVIKLYLYSCGWTKGIAVELSNALTLCFTELKKHSFLWSHVTGLKIDKVLPRTVKALKHIEALISLLLLTTRQATSSIIQGKKAHFLSLTPCSTIFIAKWWTVLKNLEKHETVDFKSKSYYLICVLNIYSGCQFDYRGF